MVTSMRPLYLSVALREEWFSALSAAQRSTRARWGWEYTPPRHGVIYGRLHLSGPEAPRGEFGRTRS